MMNSLSYSINCLYGDIWAECFDDRRARVGQSRSLSRWDVLHNHSCIQKVIATTAKVRLQARIGSMSEAHFYIIKEENVIEAKVELVTGK